MTTESNSKYTVVIAPSKDKLLDEVNSLIEAGWTPQGGLSIEYPANAVLPMYGQALVKGLGTGAG
ncbi:hypothetical protein HMEPL2_35190 [Vreelandella aquamarina]|uniref:DUF1737 domain-containing protein n=1 Tax=Vreelandella aquamarina TaxID=77097 RepID=A0A6F8XH87_9GAMM|nr:DUF1737 domain-containing protein [Halomonas meridiana]BCB73168.1 hypothetical protein HMEPL2_35190 [Halomonas meridiana]